MIYFNEEQHKYTNSVGEVYISATQFLEHFVQDFEEDKDFWLYYKAIQYLSEIPNDKIKKYDEGVDYLVGENIFSPNQYRDIQSHTFEKCNKDVSVLLSIFNQKELDRLHFATTVIEEHWLNENKKANKKGTAFHNWKEDTQLKNKMFEYKGCQLPVYTGNRDFDLSNLQPNVYTELRLWNHPNALAGTADQVIILPEKKVFIRDWKTNKEIKTFNQYQKMKFPVNHLDDCNLNHYNLQLSLYAWMLEQFGYRVVGLEIEHFNIEADGESDFTILDSTIYEFRYMKKEIEDMINYYNEHVQIQI